MLNLIIKIYDQICNTSGWKVPSFLEYFNYTNEYQETLKLFPENDASHSENNASELLI